MITVTLPTTTTVTDPNCAKTAKKRNIAIPTGIDKYMSKVLSSACSCLSLKPSATTTVTGIASIAVTKTVTAPAATATEGI
ncbi:hypothetical protein N0V88_006746 [Collariella sp. IMI 366227]|nr:hypothetical protein N0V88_006746 [Collariella sp. IMI 366227]